MERDARPFRAYAGQSKLAKTYADIIDFGISTFGEHPARMLRNDTLLWSINERLGALCPEGVGCDTPKPDGFELSDAFFCAKSKQKPDQDDDIKASTDEEIDAFAERFGQCQA